MRRLDSILVVALVGCVDRDAAEGSASSSAATASESDTAGQCGPDPAPNPEYICCDGAWIDPRSNRGHCGDCLTACSSATPFCDQGTCAPMPACTAELCSEDATCCGTQCCAGDEICCTINGPVESGPGCSVPEVDGSCPAGCAPLCKCAAPDTAIATPFGDRPIAALERGDLVYSIDDGAIAVVPIARVQRVAVADHRVARVVLDDGNVLRITPGHPLADGRVFGDIAIGQRHGDATVVDVATVAYDEPFTHDILPMSSTATYFVAGEPIASTMR